MSTPEIIVMILALGSAAWSGYMWWQNRKLDRELRERWRREFTSRRLSDDRP